MSRVSRSTARPLLICGGGGSLGRSISIACRERGLQYRAHSHEQLDICDPTAIAGALECLNPWAVINAAGYARVSAAEHEPDRCFQENVEGARALAVATSRRGIPLLIFSSHLVFDGSAGRPYLESSAVNPLGNYGRSKVGAERAVLTQNPQALCVRTAGLFGSPDSSDFLSEGLRALARGRGVAALDDVIVSPTFIPDLVTTSLDLLIDGECGLWHLSNLGAVSWAELFRQAATASAINFNALEPRRWTVGSSDAIRPRFSVLGSERGILLPPLANALTRFAAANPG
jgi:dTDP-4-dehydrorhamnose reductase